MSDDDLFEIMAQRMAAAENDGFLGGVWYHQTVQEKWLKRARTAYQVVKEAEAKAPALRPLPFLRR